MENAGAAVAREIVKRWSKRPVTIRADPQQWRRRFRDRPAACRSRGPSPGAARTARPFEGEARHHAQRWRGATEPLTPAALEGANSWWTRSWRGLSRGWTSGLGNFGCRARKGSPVVALTSERRHGDTGETLGASGRSDVTFFRRSPATSCCPVGRCAATHRGRHRTPPSVLNTIAPTRLRTTRRFGLGASHGRRTAATIHARQR